MKLNHCCLTRKKIMEYFKIPDFTTPSAKRSSYGALLTNASPLRKAGGAGVSSGGARPRALSGALPPPCRAAVFLPAPQTGPGQPPPRCREGRPAAERTHRPAAPRPRVAPRSTSPRQAAAACAQEPVAAAASAAPRGAQDSAVGQVRLCGGTEGQPGAVPRSECGAGEAGSPGAGSEGAGCSPGFPWSLSTEVAALVASAFGSSRPRLTCGPCDEQLAGGSRAAQSPEGVFLGPRAGSSLGVFSCNNSKDGILVTLRFWDTECSQVRSCQRYTRPGAIGFSCWASVHWLHQTPAPDTCVAQCAGQTCPGVSGD